MVSIFRLALRNKYQNGVFLIVILVKTHGAFSQEIKSKKDTLRFRSEVSATNNGFSFNPAFTLGKPAAILDMSIAWRRFSFEPQFRFSLEGKPWSFIFIYRYKIVANKKFQLSLGTHLPGMPFISRTVTTAGVTITETVINRYVVAEFIPTYFITPNTNIGIYYNYAHGIEPEAIQHLHFFSIRAGFFNVKMSRQFRLNATPQFFYTKLDARQGYYFSAAVSVAKIHFPVSVGAAMYQAFQTDVAGKTFNWNVSLIYTFNKKYVSQ
jgi:hypothetical protein